MKMFVLLKALFIVKSIPAHSRGVSIVNKRDSNWRTLVNLVNAQGKPSVIARVMQVDGQASKLQSGKLT